MGKKLGYGIVGLILIAVIYYFTSGSTQIVERAKAQLNTELTTLRQNGFVIKNRRSDAKEDHFVIRFDNPEKIAAFFTKQGNPATPEDITVLEGLEIGADVDYLNDLYSALSIDLYPIRLPNKIIEEANDDTESKAVLAKIEKMFREKKLLLHIDIAKDLKHFKGTMKDINETFPSKEPVSLYTEGLTFEGVTDNERIAQLDQHLKTLSLYDTEGMKIVLHNMTSHYVLTGTSPYDMDASYYIDRITLAQQGLFEGVMEKIDINTTQKVTNGLLESHVQSQTKQIEIAADTEHLLLQHIKWDAAVDNIDIAALEALQQLDPQKDEKAFNEQLKRLLSNGIVLYINDFSAQEIMQDQSSLGGISLRASFSLDKQADLSRMDKEPMMLLNALEAQSTLRLSEKIFALISQDPRAMMLMMIIPPQEEKGMKVYDLKFSKGQTTLNGQPL